MTDFRHLDDATLVRYWNEREGSMSWLMKLEDELLRRGYTTRGEDGFPRTLNIADGLT